MKKVKVIIICIILLGFVGIVSEPTNSEIQRKILLTINRYNGPSILATDGTHFVNGRGQKCYVKRIAEEYMKELKSQLI